MRHLWRSVIWLAGLVLGCAKASADDAPPRVALDLVAAGDTVKLYVSWTAANKATGAQLTITASATNGTWAVLPTAAPVVAGGTAAIVTNSPTADSATFAACLRSTLGPVVSVGQTCVQKNWKRTLQPPPIVTFDSLIGMMIAPPSPTVLTGSTTLFCTFGKFASGAIVLGSADTACAGLYAQVVPATARAKSRPALVAIWDTVCVTFTATGGTIDSPVCL